VLTEEVKFDYVIRFRGNITVTSAAGETRTAAAFVDPADALAARRLGDGRPLSGGNRAVRAGQGDETGLVSGRQQHQRDFAGFDEPRDRLWLLNVFAIALLTLVFCRR
jgi:hypothetical protein